MLYFTRMDQLDINSVSIYICTTLLSGVRTRHQNISRPMILVLFVIMLAFVDAKMIHDPSAATTTATRKSTSKIIR